MRLSKYDYVIEKDSPVFSKQKRLFNKPINERLIDEILELREKIIM